MSSNVWKLQDAKARLSEVVRRAMAGEPQQVTLHGKEAVAVVDTSRFDVTPKPPGQRTGREFVEASKKYRGMLGDFEFSRHTGFVFRDRSRSIFDDGETGENEN
jgi:prevent-host-death family protein